MRFISFIASDGTRKAGVVNSRLRAVTFSSLGLDGPQAPMDVLGFIRRFGTELPGTIRQAAESADESYDLASVKLLAPIPEVPRNVICLGKNYVEHVKEMRDKIKDITGLPEYPIYFSKLANPAAAHGDDIRLDEEITGQLDYEAELGVVIGRKCRNVKREEALDYVFGYTIINDISARDLQQKHIQWFKGKNLDGFCPIGPWIVHASSLPDPMNLRISCRVNGEIRQDSNTSNMIFDLPFIIEDLSSAMTLYPGDVISTGTPEGVGMGFTPPRFLNKGDTVECSIENIGMLKNRIV